MVAGALFALAFLAMPFSVFGLKGRLDGVEARLDEIQREIRSLALRLPEPGRAGHARVEYEEDCPIACAGPNRAPARPSHRARQRPTARHRRRPGGCSRSAPHAPNHGSTRTEHSMSVSAVANPTEGAVGRIAFVSARSPVASEAHGRMVARYGDAPLASAQAIVALGGDGHLLETMHAMTDRTDPDLRHELRLGRVHDEPVPRG